MSVANLHSLLAGQWMIDKSSAMALQPYLLSILTGKEVPAMENAYALHYASADENGSFLKSKNKSEQSVAIVSIKSPILKYSQSCGPKGTKELGEILTKLDNDPAIKGIVLDIDSGGGQVSGTAEFAELIHNLKKPVVTYTDGMLASAAYYIASAGNHIISNKHADRIGSAGTYIELIDVSGVIEKAGGKIHTVYATQSTKKNEEIRKLLDDNDSSLIIKQILDPITDKFHTEIFCYRPQLDEKVKDGRAVSPAIALQLGLVDSIGNLADAVAKVNELADSNSNNHIDMSEDKNYKNVASILGLDELKLKSGLLGGKKGFTLSADQLEKLDEKLAVVIAGEQKASEEKERLTALETAIAGAMEVAGVEGDDQIAGISAMAELAKKYNEGAGANPTKPIVTEDPKGATEVDVLEEEFEI